MSEYYTMKIAGLERKLEKFPVSDKLDIAAFIIFGDVELTIKGCEELLKKVPEFDIILTPEAKSIPMAYEMARQSGKPYVIARKGVKVYMRNPLEVNVTSITTQKEQKLFLGETEVNMIKGKKVSEALELTNKAVVGALDGLPPAKVHCSVLAEEAIKKALQDYYDKNGIEYDKNLFPDCHDCEHCHN